MLRTAPALLAQVIESRLAQNAGLRASANHRSKEAVAKS
jgi:hypothetical protein